MGDDGRVGGGEGGIGEVEEMAVVVVVEVVTDAATRTITARGSEV